MPTRPEGIHPQLGNQFTLTTFLMHLTELYRINNLFTRALDRLLSYRIQYSTYKLFLHFAANSCDSCDTLNVSICIILNWITSNDGLNDATKLAFSRALILTWLSIGRDFSRRWRTENSINHPRHQSVGTFMRVHFFVTLVYRKFACRSKKSFPTFVVVDKYIGTPWKRILCLLRSFIRALVFQGMPVNYETRSISSWRTTSTYKPWYTRIYPHDGT